MDPSHRWSLSRSRRAPSSARRLGQSRSRSELDAIEPIVTKLWLVAPGFTRDIAVDEISDKLIRARARRREQESGKNEATAAYRASSEAGLLFRWATHQHQLLVDQHRKLGVQNAIGLSAGVSICVTRFEPNKCK